MASKRDRDRAYRLRKKRKQGKRLPLKDHKFLRSYGAAQREARSQREVAREIRKARSKKASRSSALVDARRIVLALALWCVEATPRQLRDMPKSLRPTAKKRGAEVRKNLIAYWEREPERGVPGIGKAITTFRPWPPPVAVDFPEGFEPSMDLLNEGVVESLTLGHPELPEPSGRAVSAIARYGTGKSAYWSNVIALTRDWEDAEKQFVLRLERALTRYEEEEISGISAFVR